MQDPRSSLTSKTARFALLLIAFTSSNERELHAQGSTILMPASGSTFTADPCPFSECRAEIRFQVQVPGPAFDWVVLALTPDTGLGAEHTLCSPDDPIEPGDTSCPAPPFLFDETFRVRPGVWSVVARITRAGVVETSAPVSFTVLPPTLTPSGTVALHRVEPGAAAPAIRVRAASSPPSFGDTTNADTVAIQGENLASNQFLRVFLSPIPFNEPSLGANDPLPVSSWCRFEAEIVDRNVLADGTSEIVVELPELPLLVPTTCSPPVQVSSIFEKNWRWVIQDPWARPERVHEWWAIPSPRPGPGAGATPFRVIKTVYPDIDGFRFANRSDDTSLYEFLSIYGNNAYLCVGAFGLCATRIPDPVYWTLGLPYYKVFIGLTGGSCAGMSATSLLMAREELQTERFESDVYFPIALSDPGNATYDDPDFCTPWCSPPKPDNLWAHIRMNHGVQTSREFLQDLLESLGEAIFNPDELSSIKGLPNATLDRVRANPTGHVLCFFEWGGGHCVAPYRVEGERIWIYDNNHPRDESKYIEIIGGDYNYPGRKDSPNHGNAIAAFPIDIWSGQRHLVGLTELTAAGVEFLQMIAFGGADMSVSNDAGGRWGWEPDGTFTDAMLGAVSIPALGPPPEPVRQMPLLLAMNQPPPNVQINARGGRYFFQTGHGGQVIQLESGGAENGDRDAVQLTYENGALSGVTFEPQRRTSAFAAKTGLVIGEQERAVLQLLGLEVPAGRRASISGDRSARAVTYRNDTGAPTHHVVKLDHASGLTGAFGQMLYGPFETPQGASHRVVLAGWPNVNQVRSELDLDSDGTPEVTTTVPGRAIDVLPVGDPDADVSVEKTVSPTTVGLGEPAIYTLYVRNHGPGAAINVVLGDQLTPVAAVEQVATTHGSCITSDGGLTCALGTLGIDETAVVSYSVRTAIPGVLANGATVSSSTHDMNWTNNTAVRTVMLPAAVDIRPGSADNPVNLRSAGVIEVAVLGSPHFGVSEVDEATLRFGPAGAPLAPPGRTHLADVNRDGIRDLVGRFRTQQSGLSASDTVACVQGMTRSGRAFRGCDRIRIVP